MNEGVQNAHGLADFRERERVVAREVDEHAAGALQVGAFKQRTGDRLFGGDAGAVRTRRGRETDDRRAAFAHHRLDVFEVDVDRTGRVDDFRDADAGLVEHFVARFEAFLHRRVGRAFLFELFVEDDDHRVDLVLEVLDAELGRTHAAGAFEAEGLRDDGHREDAHLLRDFGNDGSRTRTGAAAHAGRDEEQVRAANRFGHLFALFLRGGGAHFGTRTRAEPGAAELDVHVSLRALKGLVVGIGRNELNTLGAVRNHVFDGIAAATADADHLDHGVQRINLLQDFKRHRRPLLFRISKLSLR